MGLSCLGSEGRWKREERFGTSVRDSALEHVFLFFSYTIYLSTQYICLDAIYQHICFKNNISV